MKRGITNPITNDRKIKIINESVAQSPIFQNYYINGEDVRGMRSNGRPGRIEKEAEQESQTLYTREITCFVNSAAVTNGYSGGI